MSISTNAPPVGRRVLLGGIGALGMPFIRNAAAAEPIRIGMIYAKTGQIADQAEYLAQGTTMALEQRNNTILGRPAELIWLDEPSPQAAQQNAERLVGEYKVAGLIGGSLSSFALAISAVAKRAKVPFIASNAAVADLTGKSCNRFTFRLQPPTLVHARALAPYVMSYGKKWYFLTASYAFGQDIRRSFMELLKEGGGTVAGADEVPLNTPDYSSFILKIRQAKPDAIVGGISGNDLTTFLKQWNELGMKGKIPFTEISVGDTDLWGVGPEAATGTFTKVWYYDNPNNSAEDRAFAAAYQAKHKRPAADKAWMGWFGMKTLLESIEAAGTTDSAAVVSALEHWHAPDGQVRYREWDHQMTRRLLIAEVKPTIPDKWNYFDIKATLPASDADVQKAFGTREEIGCTMEAS